ncbi:hypothetical protein [Caulobacter sp. 17J80-11]|uniref:hypothetical protein n=1 Tax=Caulobacter sp. 17J80-11 TaxID=2763502 RepID=UPI001653D799|nr:hypothetical protein [Caulobacter sp. 17J80-11]MBC6983168.1 hypothetical protein [Caulobacter sp. 17J80-11]
MNRLLITALAILAPGVAAAQSAEPTLCPALDGLRAEAISSGTPQRVTVFAEDSMAFVCRREKNQAALKDFCSAAFDVVGIEFTHGFPWEVADCLEAAKVRPSLELVDQYTGLTDRKKITHLTAGWRDGVRIDIRYVPSGDFSSSPQNKDYYGRYDLVVWKP